jgi:hypothetical protein
MHLFTDQLNKSKTRKCVQEAIQKLLLFNVKNEMYNNYFRLKLLNSKAVSFQRTFRVSFDKIINFD